MTHWYYIVDGAQEGPASEEDLKHVFQSGALPLNTPVWREDMTDWVAARSLLCFGRENATYPIVQTTPPPPLDTLEAKTVPPPRVQPEGLPAGFAASSAPYAATNGASAVSPNASVSRPNSARPLRAGEVRAAWSHYLLRVAIPAVVIVLLIGSIGALVLPMLFQHHAPSVNIKEPNTRDSTATADFSANSQQRHADSTFGEQQHSFTPEQLIRLRANAERGLPEAQCGLGAMFQYGLGVTKDYSLAMAWYRKAAAQGDAWAQYSLGNMFCEGQGIARDNAQALEWYLKAAAQDHVKAQYEAGSLLCEGQGVATNYAEALKWYRKAAEQGYAPAQHDLGNMYCEGRGVVQDYVEALKWCRAAAEQDYAPAAFSLGVMYNQGQGVAEDYGEAVRWYRRAAEQGFSPALVNLSVMYYFGRGVEVDRVEAFAYLDLAARDITNVASARSVLGSQMSSQEIAAGHNRSKELREVIRAPRRSDGKDEGATGISK